jgi:hypothetical protein
LSIRQALELMTILFVRGKSLTGLQIYSKMDKGAKVKLAGSPGENGGG